MIVILSVPGLSIKHAHYFKYLIMWSQKSKSRNRCNKITILINLHIGTMQMFKKTWINITLLFTWASSNDNISSSSLLFSIWILHLHFFSNPLPRWSWSFFFFFFLSCIVCHLMILFSLRSVCNSLYIFLFSCIIGIWFARSKGVFSPGPPNNCMFIECLIIRLENI